MSWLAALCLAGCAQDPAATDAVAAPASDATSAIAPVQPARLKVSGAQILAPSGKPIIMRGYNWGQWGTVQPQDGADNAGQGANSVRLPLRWWGDWKDGVDSRDDGAPGHIDPAHLALLDQTVQWAAQNHLWATIFVDSNNGQGAEDATNGDDNFWTDPAMKQKFIEVWQFLVQRYRNVPYIAAYEILPEPRPTGVSNASVRAFYDSIIPSIRALDARTPIVVGPNNAYNLHDLDDAYTTIDNNLIYTGDYFIFPDADPLNRMPFISDFQTTRNAPVWINQVGILTGDDGAMDLATQVLDGLEPLGVGWSWWTYRELTTSPDQHGIYYSDVNGGWILKPDWFTFVGSYF
ncbi:MAG TPA: cellulase family glycosylhydrolase [Kofleriaceae bacterium]|nr:cellulase family glycosylhydrolase [Kofleriaceae bacterium]